MFRYIFKTALRHLWIKRFFSVINLAGLVLGLTATFCITSYIHYETTHDLSHPKNTYRLISKEGGAKLDKTLSSFNYLPVTNLLNGKIPGVEKIARVQPVNSAILKADGNVFVENNFIWADSVLADIIDLKLNQGLVRDALSKPNSVILSESEANKLFPDSSPIGKSVSVNGELLAVTGVYKDMPGTNHLKKSMIGSINSLKNLDDPWSNQGFIYFKLHPKANPADISRQINRLTKGNLWWIPASYTPTYRLQAVTDIHLHSDDILLSPNPVSIKYLYIFGFVGILLICCTAFNYISLTIADFLERRNEFGIKNILGSDKKLLLLQPVAECLILCGLSAALAIVLSMSALPFVNKLFNTELTSSFYLSPLNIAALSAVLLLVAIVAGVYPLIAVARTRPLHALRSSMVSRNSRIPVRRLLIVSQFSIAIALLFVMVVIQQQMSLMGKERLGFDKNQVLILTTPRFSKINVPLIKQKLNQLAAVNSVTAAIGSPLSGGLISTPAGDVQQRSESNFSADEDYAKTLNLKIVLGEDLSANDTAMIIVNEAYVKQNELKQPLGHQTYYMGSPKVVKGVVRNFQLNNIHVATHPAVIAISDKYRSQLLVRLNTDDVNEALKSIETTWKKLEPDHPLSYSFLNEEYEQLFRSELRFQRSSRFFSIIAIVIACLGLYGAILHSARQRTKEIGIRKVLGASVQSLVSALSADFMKLVAVAFIIASPVAWWVMDRWLSDFAYRIDIKWWMFAIAGLSALVIALFTVSFQAIRTATANPVKSLKNE